MLPSMPILFSRDSQEAFGSKIQPSTSFFSQNSSPKHVIPQVVLQTPQEAPKQSEVKHKTEPEKKKNDPPIVDDNTLNNAFVRSYYQKVQSRFSSTSVPTNKFVQFRNILRNFNPNIETPIQLYKKIEELFGTEHKDIVEEFLLFLKPEQAVEIGRFMDRYQLVQINGFINMLYTTFARKPTVLRKILRALATALNGGNCEEVKTRILPHLRSNPRLTRAFKSLFPDERPPDSVYESGVDMANESFLTNDRGYDVWEFEDEADNKKKLGVKEELDTMYMNGRVFLQHGRLLRPARVTFPFSKEPYRVHARRLAPAYSHPTPPDSDVETPQKSPSKSKVPPKRTRKQTKSPTKKDVNDNTKNNCLSQLSPKPKEKKAQKIKNGKKEIECHVSKRKESKNASQKKDVDAPKTKQARIETANTELKPEIPSKAEPKIEAPSKVKLKIEDGNKVQIKVEATIKDETKLDYSSKANVDDTNKGEAKMKAPVKIENLASDETKLETPIKTEAKFSASVNVAAKEVENKSNNWTRDEDKTMLQVLKGEAGSEKVFGKIRELLPHRSAIEIKERFCHVMTLLQQMAVSEVT